MTYRVTHWDLNRRRRRLLLRNVGNVHAAIEWVTQLHGDAWCLSAVRVYG